MPVFTISFCALIIVIFILDVFFVTPGNEDLTLRKKLISGYNKGRINRVLRLSREKIKKGEVWRLVSSSLLHTGIFHVLTNSAAMLIVGFAAESTLGPLRTFICFFASTLVSGLFMAFVYKLDEGEGASPGIFGLIAVFAILAVKNGTVFFSDLPVFALVILGVYIIDGLVSTKATVCEHLSGFAGGLISGLTLYLFNLL